MKVIAERLGITQQYVSALLKRVKAGSKSK